MESETPGITESLRNAKLLLKKSKRVDYYKLLEINQDANDYDIKKVGFSRCQPGRGLIANLMQYLKAMLRRVNVGGRRVEMVYFLYHTWNHKLDKGCRPLSLLGYPSLSLSCSGLHLDNASSRCISLGRRFQHISDSSQLYSAYA